MECGSVFSEVGYGGKDGVVDVPLREGCAVADFELVLESFVDAFERHCGCSVVFVKIFGKDVCAYLGITRKEIEWKRYGDWRLDLPGLMVWVLRI